MDLNTIVGIVIVFLILCATYVLVKYIKITNETKVELKRIEKGEPKKETSKQRTYDSFRTQEPYWVEEKYFASPKDSSIIKDSDPTTMFQAVTPDTKPRYYIAEEQEEFKTTKMPVVKTEGEKQC